MTGGLRHLDRRPDRERRREVVTGHDEVRPVAHAELVDLAEQVVFGVAREDVRESRFDPDADEGEPSSILPLAVLGELLVAELDARQRVRLLRVGRRQAHRHVEVGRAGGQCTVEDRHDEARVDRVEHVGDAVRLDEPCHRIGTRGVDLGRLHAGSATSSTSACGRAGS
jgi:hypothetical protein